ncbi:hypothetical protein AB0P21_22805 [Kribbella sp. NPDC056861]|uniref:hypothetical protein n=1 Tax=Kribbella sp. NPDC056861 TaxID=3154857 RepID=UPI0034185559
MPITGLIALALGVVVAAVAAYVVAGTATPTDPQMVWEARVAVGFGALILAGPLFVAQLVFTILAMPRGGPIWLWLWLFAAPALGGSLVASAVRAVRGRR